MKKTEKGSFGVIKGDFREKQKSNVPRMPEGMTVEAKKWWKKVLSKLDKDKLVPGDAIALMLLCDAFAGYERTLETLRKKGETYEAARSDGSIIERPRPEVDILSMYAELVYSGLREFLLTVNSRKELGL